MITDEMVEIALEAAEDAYPESKRSDMRAALKAVAPMLIAPWAKEATIAWTVCASIHREYAKGRDPFFKTRQADFVKAADKARAQELDTPEKEPRP